MAEPAETGSPISLNRGRLAGAALCVGAALLGVGATAWLLIEVWSIARAPQPSIVDFAGAALLWLAAGCFALLLWGLAESLRQMADMAGEAAMGGASRMVPGAEARPAAAAMADPGLSERIQELIDLTKETRDIALLSDAERAMRLRTEAEALARELRHDVPHLIREHNWVEARRRVQEARTRFPALPLWDDLEKQVEEARTNVRARDVENAMREVRDLVALGAFDRAMQVVRDLQQRHPDAPQVGELARRVVAEREKATAEERAKLMARAQEATNRRDWTVALQNVEEVLARFPNSPEAEELRQQLPTLRANVEIQTRQRMEAQIRDLIKDHHYREALRIARIVIDQYPNSPQAAVLREQLPRIEQRAKAEV